MSDLELLQQFVQTHSEQAFASLVRHHIDWVHSAALRQVRDRHLAEDVTQAVFVILARKARSLRLDQPLSPWLHQVTRYVAINALRARSRRQDHEQGAAAMKPRFSTTTGGADWEEMAPMLDELVGKLGKKDRQAILLRFYERQSFGEMGEALGVSEEAARKRTERAVEKLRGMFSRKGIAVASAALVAGIEASVTHAVGPALTASTTAAAMAAVQGGPVGASVLTIAQGAMKMMAWAKLKLVACVAAAVVVLASGAGGIALRQAWAQQQAAPTATAAPSPAAAAGSGFVATLPNGLTLEVVGACSYPSQGQTWWRPDGSPLADRPYDSMAGIQLGQAGREWAVRIANQPAEQATVRWSIAPGGTSQGAGSLVRPRGEGLEAIAVVPAPAGQTIIIVCDVAAGAWQTKCTAQPAMMGTGGTGGSFAFAAPVQSNRATIISVADDLIGWDHRVVAIDRQGQPHYASRAGSVSVRQLRLTTAQFEDLVPGQIAEVQFQARQFDTQVIFSGVAVNPGPKTSVQMEVRNRPPTGSVLQGLGRMLGG